MQEKEDSEVGGCEPQTWELSVAMLLDILDGKNYEQVAQLHGMSRSAVERRIKLAALHVARSCSIPGLNERSIKSVRRLRDGGDALRAALKQVQAPVQGKQERAPILSEPEIEAGAKRIRARCPKRPELLVLYYLLFATGARPLEIARLKVRDYLDADGNVRQASVLRAEVTITSRERPVFFRSKRLNDALEAYLAERRKRGWGLDVEGRYRGLDPESGLLLAKDGSDYPITLEDEGGIRQFTCNAIKEDYRRVFRYAEIGHVSARTARNIFADRVYARGGDETHVSRLLGIASLSAVRAQFPRRIPALEDVILDLV